MGMTLVLQGGLYEIQRIKREGTTILLVKQNALMALTVAAIGYVQQTGAIVLQHTAASPSKNPMVQKAYLGMQ
jgi:ABC-type branched-subunit amino acid transport system ATPase component